MPAILTLDFGPRGLWTNAGTGHVVSPGIPRRNCVRPDVKHQEDEDVEQEVTE
jgi:hypothetical protein